MKKKDIITLIVSIVIFMVAGVLIYRFIVPPPKDTGIKVIIPRPVKTSFDSEIIKILRDKEKGVTDFTPSIDPDPNAPKKPIIE